MAGDSPVPVEPFEIALGDLVLRAFREADLADVVAVYRDEEVQHWNPQQNGIADETEAAAAFIRGRADWSARDHLSWAVAEAAGDRIVGSVSLHHLDLLQGTGEVGYWTAPWARGRGVASRAVLAATGAAFRTVGLRRVELYHATANAASCRVAERAGYLLEGVLRQSYVYGDGIARDEHLHARLAPDPDPVR